jgi:hypothetical protein
VTTTTANTMRAKQACGSSYLFTSTREILLLSSSHTHVCELCDRQSLSGGTFLSSHQGRVYLTIITINTDRNKMKVFSAALLALAATNAAAFAPSRK